MINRNISFGIKSLIIVLLLILVPIVLSAQIRFYTEEEYQDLSKEEVEQYWEELETELMLLQKREADAEQSIENNEKRIAELKARITAVEREYDEIYNGILTCLGGVSHSELVDFQRKLNEIKSKLDYYDQLPSSELLKKNQEIKKFIAHYNQLKDESIAKVPEIASEFNELDPRINQLNKELPHYYEDKHVVVKGEYLGKIAGYKHIYNDPAKWGIIYRANRDKIKDPDLIYPDQVFKIPRGLPTTWKVYKGECLWTISSYPEIYDNPFKWPKIYRANTDKIEDPDLIYPNQILRIPRD